MYKKAEAGIGTLILFIALILVAAVASMVYIQTSNSLQSKALATGSQTQAQVSSGVSILRAWGENASNGQRLDRFYFTAKLIPGSDPVPINESYVSFATQDERQTFRYNTTGSCNVVDDILNAGQTNTFIVTGLVGYSIPGFLLDGDVVTICISNAITNVSESEQLTISFVPKVGSIASVTTATPNAMTEAKIPLFPN